MFKHMPEDSTLVAADLSYRYGKTLVWEGLSFSLKQGEIAFLIGSNGAGKSTLLRCLAGWSKLHSGSVSVCGHSVYSTGNAYRSKIAFVPDTPSFYDDLTAEEHIHFILNANNLESKHDEAERLLHAFGLSPHVEQLPSSYSRGMKEKLALVIALMFAPPLLLLDEAYGPLDKDSSFLLSKELERLAQLGSSIIISCHHPIPHLVPQFLLQLQDKTLHVENAETLKKAWMTDADAVAHTFHNEV